MCVFVGCVCVPKSSSLKVAKPKNEISSFYRISTGPSFGVELPLKTKMILKTWRLRAIS